MNRIVRFNLTADNYADDDGFSSTLLFVNIENGYRKPEPGSFQYLDDGGKMQQSEKYV